MTTERPERFDAIVIGAGHNGLVCAALLGKAGKRVLVLEAGSQVGGATVTREFADGFAVSACAHLVYQLQPAVTRALDFKPKYAVEGLDTVALDRAGAHVRYAGGELRGAGAGDTERYRDFHRRMTRYAGVLEHWLNRPPPRLATRDLDDRLGLLGMGLRLRRLGKRDMREFLRLIASNMHDELDAHFASPLLKGALALDAVLGTGLGPRSPNSVMTYLYRLAGGGEPAVPAGGMGLVAADLAGIANNAGVDIRTDSAVARIVVETGRVAGVETVAGRRFDSRTVISNADPKRTIVELLGARHVETGFTRRIHHIRMQGTAAKLHLALDGLPEMPGLEPRDYAQRLVIAPDAHYVERAFNPVKYAEFSPQPVIEMIFPSLRDTSLAPDGKHVMSAIVQYVPYALAGALASGWHETARQALIDTVLQTIQPYAPDLESHIVASELLTPADIEREFLITGGHWHHGELALAQCLFVRPVAGAAQYRMPIDGLYLCGAGTHPGGGVSGAAGRNAANVILERDKT